MCSAGDVSWYRPLTLERLLEVARDNVGCKFVGGNTEVGIEMHIQGAKYKVLVDPTMVPEMCGLEEEAAGLRVCNKLQVYRCQHSCVHVKVMQANLCACYNTLSKYLIIQLAVCEPGVLLFFGCCSWCCV